MVVEYLFLLNPQFLLLEEPTLKHIVKCDAAILDELKEAISTIPGNHSIVLCGDFNVPNIN